MITYFMFATGIENSAPKVNGRRVDSDMYEYQFDNGLTREEYADY